MAWEGIEKPILGTPRMRKGERTRYVPNHRSFGAFMKSEQMRDVTTQVAEDIANTATGTQPPPTSDSEHAGATYKVKRMAGFAKVAGNIRVRVLVEGRGDGVERAEFGTNGETRYRTLAAAGGKFGDFKHGEAVGR